MQWYVYKCNSKNRDHQNHFGDWREFFESAKGHVHRWGTSSIVPALEELLVGDKILAYQTDLNAIMGIVQVDHWLEVDGRDYVFLRPHLRLGTDGVRVRPLKSDERIAEIHAFKTRQIKTLYEISEDDAQYILSAAEACCETTAYDSLVE